jgi:hypothetical protein
MRSIGPEHANHHCDADIKFKNFPTLIEAVLDDPSLLNAADWNRYFDSFAPKEDPFHRGILPFRVWQYFIRLKEYATTDPAKFIAAAGTLAHYIGDASQPLHGSVFSDGIPGKEPDIPRKSRYKDEHGNEKSAHRGEGVHSAYETDMIDMAARNGELFGEIRKNLGAAHGMHLAADGRGAALATLECMREVATILPPVDLIDVYERSFAADSPPHNQALWSELRNQTGRVMAIGVKTLAMIWDAAWAAGGGNANPGRIRKEDLRAHYEDVNFMRSVTVNEIEVELGLPNSQL